MRIKGCRRREGGDRRKLEVRGEAKRESGEETEGECGGLRKGMENLG